MNVVVLDDYVPASLVEQLLEIDAPGVRDAREFTDRTRAEVPEDSTAFLELRELLLGADLVQRAEQFDDLAWRLYWSGTISRWEAFVSRYDPGGVGYTWHVDQGINRRALNWIATLNDVPGGELEISSQPFSFQRDDVPAMRAAIRLAPKVGRLVIFPACYPHRVQPSPAGRVVAHGHFDL